MKELLALLFVAVFSLPQKPKPQDYPARKQELEDAYAQGSFELAQRGYSEIDAPSLPPSEQRWIAFRLADTQWRSRASSANPDATELDRARAALEELQRKVERPEERDETWALIEESLGDWHWLRRDAQNLGGALPHYQAALDWWSGAREIEKARERYLGIVFRLATPARGEWGQNWWLGQVPPALFENAIRIANDPEDKARAQFHFAVAVRQRGADFGELRRGLEHLAQAIESGQKNPWFDDALFVYAQWLEQQGTPSFDPNGQWVQRPDHVGALAAYRRIIATFRKGDSAYYDQARDGIERILRSELSVSVPSAFLPDSEVGYALAWRNVERIELALYELDLVDAVALEDGTDRAWLETIDVAALEKTESWTHATGDERLHRPGQAELRIASKLAPGAYVLEARAGSVRARELVLITRSSLFVKSAREKVLVWYCDALDSTPIARARVRLWTHRRVGNNWIWKSATGETGTDGTALFDIGGGEPANELFVAAQSGARAAFSLGQVSWRARDDAASWRILAFTDRSAYRPDDTVRWKATARVRKDGAYTTPSDANLDYEIVDPRGAVAARGELVLNEFGSGWGELATNGGMPLGEYSIRFRTQRKKARIELGSAQLFRLEEYKLPEFEVGLEFPKENGKTKVFRTGERIEVDVVAELYAGGAVADASVEVLVHQKPYWRRWIPLREYGWLYAEQDAGRSSSWGPGQIVRRETLKTDATGRARLVIDTPANAGEDYEYTVEARVTDASRREVAGSGSVRVTRQAYAVDARTEHKLYRPGDAVEVVFEAKDANDNPVETEGRVRVTRERWIEVWIDPQGREMRASEFEKLRGGRIPFPPAPVPGERAWRLKFRGYESEEVTNAIVRTDARGAASLVFTPLVEGFYRAAWTSKDDRGSPIVAETALWVATGDTRELGYHAGGLEIVVDKETFHAGETAPVMISVPAQNRWVLFGVEGDDLLSWQVVHVAGTVKLIMVAIEEKHVPNVYLSAATAHEGDALVDVQEVVVPPVEQFLDVELAPDRTEVQPGEQGRFRVLVKDRHGEPVAAEVALAVVDEAVAAIQQDYAADPRQFFHGARREHAIVTSSSFEQRSYRRLVVGALGELVDERQALLDGPMDARFQEGSEELDSMRSGRRRENRLAKSHSRGDSFQVGRTSNADEMRFGAAPSAVAAREMADGPAGSGGEIGAVVVRTNFEETALWQPSLVTGTDGCASVDLAYPDSLTRWKASARVIGRDAKVGLSSATVRAQKPLTARLQAPRFFVIGDLVTVSGVIANRTSEPLSVAVDLAASGMRFAGPAAGDHTIEAGGEVRIDWRLEPVEAGPVTIRLTARSVSSPHSDAMERTYPIEPHGIEAFVARSLKLRSGTQDLLLDMPAERRRETTRLSIQVSPSLAVTMLDALPYLVEYPYGCTEQTLSRFLPAAIVARTLEKRGLSAEVAMSRVFGGIEVESAATTHPKGKRSLEELAAITRAGLERLYDFQRADGGWGWWKGGAGDPYMTAYVVWGLSLARDAGLDVDRGRLERGAQWLEAEIVEAEKTPDLAAWMLHALAAQSPRAIADARVVAAFAALWKQHTVLNAYGRALFALAAHAFEKRDEARLLAQNLANGVQIETPDVSRIDRGSGAGDPRTQKTAHWGAERGWWRWSEGAVESTAFALRALVAIDPSSELVEQASSWLVANRRGAQWSSTKDTSIAVLALGDYLDQSGEVARDVEYELSVNGEVIARKRLSADEMLSAPSRFDVPAGKVKDGANVIRLARVAGEGPLYLSARAEFFSLEEPIPARGSEVFARRQYFKLVGRPTLLKGLLYDKVPLEDGGRVASGERVEVVLTLESKNDYEYVVFEDLKPAGLEAAGVKSGEFLTARELKSGEVDHRFGSTAPAFVPEADDWQRYTGRQQHVHHELRDRKVAVFLDRLPQGVWEVRYELRAEVPGSFHALPVLGHAMYVPEIRCNGAETRIEVTERDRGGD